MKSLFSPIREIVLFSVPLILGQIGHMVFAIGDTLFIGHYSTEALSALGVATAILTPLLIIALGILSLISPMKATKIAAGESTPGFFKTTLFLGVGCGVLLTILLVLCGRILPYFGISERVTALSSTYLQIVSISMVPTLLFQVCKENLQAREKTIFANGLIWFANGVNLLLNYVLIYTFNWGLHGAAIATTLSRMFMFLVLYKYTLTFEKCMGRISFPLLWKFMRKGIPVGFSSVATALIFSLVTLLSARFSITASAANNVIITLSSVTFMIPCALSAAVSVKVGHTMGSNKHEQLQYFYRAAIFVGILTSTMTMTLFLRFPDLLLHMVSQEKEVVHIGAILLVIVALYQIPDTVQSVTQGVLRGMGITFRPFIYSLLGIWGIGFPLGYYLAFFRGLDVFGLWIGMGVGVIVLSVLFTILCGRGVKRSLSV